LSDSETQQDQVLLGGPWALA